MVKKRITVRINPYNYDILKAIADTLFLNENQNKGNVSQALDWILTRFKNDTKYKGLVQFLVHKANYDRGSRTKEDIEAMKNLLIFIESVEESTKISKEKLL